MESDSVAIFANAPAAKRNHDTEHIYNPDPNFYYLTGFEEPESICVIAPDKKKNQYVLFVLPKDEKAEIWDGKRVGVKEACEHYGADKAYSIKKFNKRIGKVPKKRKKTLLHARFKCSCGFTNPHPF